LTHIQTQTYPFPSYYSTHTANMSAALVTDVDKRLLRTTKFPPEFEEKVDMSKVNISVIKKWISDELARLLNNDDDIVTEMVFNKLESSKKVSGRTSPGLERHSADIRTKPNIKELQIALNGFLNKDAPKFCLELWKLCISAQKNAQGIPMELLEAKKAEIMQEKVRKCRSLVLMQS